jgi:hypothetical protein
VGKRETAAERRESQWQADQQAVYALHCDGCPYKTCVGSNAAVTFEERTSRLQELLAKEGDK